MTITAASSTKEQIRFSVEPKPTTMLVLFTVLGTYLRNLYNSELKL